MVQIKINENPFSKTEHYYGEVKIIVNKTLVHNLPFEVTKETIEVVRRDNRGDETIVTWLQQIPSEIDIKDIERKIQKQINN